MRKPEVVVFCMPEDGHFMLLRPLIAGLARLGLSVSVWTHRRFRSEIERLGGNFEDFFEKYPLEKADSESRPIPCRYVSFAGFYAEEVLRELEGIRPALIVYETFAVIGRLAALALGIPGVNVSPGHNLDPNRLLPFLSADPRVRISPRCHRSVETLRGRYQMSDASPFSYVSGLSPTLNVCCEPEAFLSAEERRVFEPLDFFGCLLSPGENREDDTPESSAYFGGEAGRPRIYACFGTVIWRYFAQEALAALRAVSDAVAEMPEAFALISLSRAEVGVVAARDLGKPNVRVLDYVDQWRVLAEADVFVTHHGVNSTHEAIFHRVPMLSYPFFADQPALAEKCEQLGIATPLASSLRGPIDAKGVRAALERLAEDRALLQESLERARAWELETMARRDSVLQRVLGLASLRGSAP